MSRSAAAPRLSLPAWKLTAATPTGGRPPQCRSFGRRAPVAPSRLLRRTRRAGGARHPVADQPLLRPRFVARAQFLAFSGGTRTASAGCRLGRAGRRSNWGSTLAAMSSGLTALSPPPRNPPESRSRWLAIAWAGSSLWRWLSAGGRQSRVWRCLPHPGILLPSGRSRRVCCGFSMSGSARRAAALPVELLQSLFFMLDPFLAQRKFVRFAALDPTGAEARSFVALEDWINDGVPLPIGVARECLARGMATTILGAGCGRLLEQRSGRSNFAGRLWSSSRPRPDRAAAFSRAAGGGDPQCGGNAPAARPYRDDVGGPRA